MSSKRALISAAVALGVSLARAAAAQEAAPAPTLLLHVAAEDVAVTAIDERLGARLRALGVTLTLRPEPTVDVAAALNDGTGVRAACEGAPLAEAWLDGLVPGEATLVLVPCGAAHALARRLAAPGGFDDVLLAELELIVDRAAQALLAAQPVGGSREAARAALDDPPPPPAPAPEPLVVASLAPAPSAEPAAIGSQLGFAAGVEGWSGGNPALPAGELFGGLERRSSRTRIGLALAVGARGAAHASTARAELSIWGGDTHLWLTVGREFRGAGLWRLSVGPGIALSHVTSSRAAGAPATATAMSRTDLDATLGAQLRWDVVAVGRAVVFAAASADVLPRAARYTAIVDGESETLVQPWRVRPSLMLGVAFDPGDQPSTQRR